MKILKPFADDRASQAIDGLTIENGRDKLSFYGSLDIGRDKTGLAKARMVAKTAKLTPRPRATPQAIRALVPGGSTARGPWGPKAIQ